MTTASTRNRKLIYGAGIAALLIPIVLLGAPAGGRGEGGGGVLARIRANPDYQLGETTLGDVDPASLVWFACGHDVHMTCWVGTARVLVDLKDHWAGALVMIGQPAEERGAGARAS